MGEPERPHTDPDRTQFVRQEAPRWHALEAEAVAELLGSGPDGLSLQEAESRLKSVGPNRIQEASGSSLAMDLLKQFKSPLIYILLIAAAVSMLVGDISDATVISVVLLLNASVGFVQQRKAEAAIRGLRQLVVSHSHVVRGGHEHEIETERVVPGDVLVLRAGGMAPADVRLFETVHVQVDESLLTGESFAVAKHSGTLPEITGAFERANMLYAGTTVLSGSARGYVVATGMGSELGKISSEILAVGPTASPLERRMEQFSRAIAVVVLLGSALVFVIGFARGLGAGEMFKTAVATAVSAIPEGLPVAVSVTLAVSVWRMARRKAIVRHLPAVETLGSTTVIATDKTGTLTLNRMTVVEVWTPEGSYKPDADGWQQATQAVKDVLLVGAMTNDASLWREGDKLHTLGDSTEVALLIAADAAGLELDGIWDRHRTIEDLPFESNLQYSATARAGDNGAVLYVKGAPEKVFAMCSTTVEEAARRTKKLAAAGYRVLAFARRELREGEAVLRALEEPKDLEFVGLVGLLDPPRKEVPAAIQACQRAGVRVLMVTGDHAETAGEIARQVGFPEPITVLTGAELQSLGSVDWPLAVERTSVFARVSPDQKHRIVQELQKLDQVVAVTGDGVNDAPALKASDIGIAMGLRGTDVAREASDMVLADDNFVSIQAAVEEGRITFENIRKVTFMLISTGAAEIGAILAALAVGLPLPFIAVQILWMNLVTNGLQDIALAFEPGERGLLEKPPRPRNEPIMSRELWIRTGIAGAVMAAGALFMFQWALTSGQHSLEEARTAALTTMVLFQAFHVGNSRSEQLSVFAKPLLSNPFLFVCTGLTLLIHLGSLYFGPAQQLLQVRPLDFGTIAMGVAVASTILVAMELHKWWIRRMSPSLH